MADVWLSHDLYQFHAVRICLDWLPESTPESFKSWDSLYVTAIVHHHVHCYNSLLNVVHNTRRKVSNGHHLHIQCMKVQKAHLPQPIPNLGEAFPVPMCMCMYMYLGMPCTCAKAEPNIGAYVCWRCLLLPAMDTTQCCVCSNASIVQVRAC